MNLIDIANKMVDSQFTFADPERKFIGISETACFGLSIAKILNETDFDYEEEEMYNVFRGYFNPLERKDPKSDYIVYIITDKEKTEIYASLIYIKLDCCTEEHDVINFNIESGETTN